MYYIDTTTNKYPITLSQIKLENKDTSFPKQPTDEQLLPFDYANVFTTQKPEYDSKLQYLTEDPPINDGSQYNQVWVINDYTQSELDKIQDAKNIRVNSDMLTQGQALTLDNLAKVDSGSTPVIKDKQAHDTWMQAVYNEVISKPPADERQGYKLYKEDADPFTFTRYQDEWGYRWRMDLVKNDVTNLALYIQDEQGNFLYTTGALLDNGNGGWYTECPAGQADQTPLDVYFHWILGAGRISSDFVYKGTEDTINNIVRSDNDYD